MIEFSGWPMFGFALGAMLFDKEDNESAGSSWGVVIYLGIIAINIVKYELK